MNTPALGYLMGAYFHEDFYAVSGGLWEALDDFLETEASEAVSVPAEIDDVLSAFSDEEELKVYLSHLGSCVYQGDMPNGYRVWLQEISRRVTRYLGDHPQVASRNDGARG